MEFKEFVQMKEAGEVQTGVRVEKDANDLYDEKKIPTIFSGEYNRNKYIGIINKLAPKFANFFSEFKSNKNAKPYIEKLGVDSKAGAQGLASLYTRVLSDAMTDANNNPIALRDESSFNVFKNRLKTQLGEKNSIMYPILFRLGRDILAGNTESAKNGAVVFLKTISQMVDSIDSDGANIYQKMKDFDTIFKTTDERDPELTRSKEYLQRDINDYIEGLRDQVKGDLLQPNDFLAMSPEEYMNLYYPVAGGEQEESEFYVLKKAMFDAIRDNMESGEEPFVRGSEADKVVKEFANYVLDSEDEDLIFDFAKAVVEGSKGSVPAIFDSWLAEVSNRYSQDLADKIFEYVNKVTKTTGDAGIGTQKRDTSSAFGQLDKDIVAAINAPTVKELRDAASKLKGKKVTKDELSQIQKMLNARVETQEPKFLAPSGKPKLFKMNMGVDILNALQVESMSPLEYLDYFKEHLES